MKLHEVKKIRIHSELDRELVKKWKAKKHIDGVYKAVMEASKAIDPNIHFPPF